MSHSWDVGNRSTQQTSAVLRPGRRAPAVLLAAVVLSAGIPIACNNPWANPNQAEPSSSGSSTSGAMSFSGCGIACDAQNPCKGEGMACLPAAKGGTICKPSTCPACPAGKVCAFDTQSCDPVGCTSDACGFAYTDACDDCVKANCCTQNLACANDPACQAIVKCSGGCTTSACTSACEQGASASADAEFKAVVACNQGSCLQACYAGGLFVFELERRDVHELERRAAGPQSTVHRQRDVRRRAAPQFGRLLLLRRRMRERHLPDGHLYEHG